MHLEEIGLAPPGPGEVRVRHTGRCALNFSDTNVRRGGFYQKEPMPMPIILGSVLNRDVPAHGIGIKLPQIGGGRDEEAAPLA